ncbi:MAG: NADAR family protein [Clostridia bacterium]|nr:NADAR family protein [Clostridia bacterium]
MAKAIKSFRGKNAFLSNFYPCLVEYEGMIFPSVEHAFQAAKTLDMQKRITFQVCPTPKEAKACGRKLKLRPDWEEIKIDVMRTLVRDKFTRNRSFQTDLTKLLLDTDDAYLEEGNNHGDRFWGTVKGEGRNELGKILMEVRDELKGEK